MSIEGTVGMIVIGADTHKHQHTLVAVDAGTGRVRGSREITASDDGHREALQWACGLDSERVWAIEDCRQVSRRLEQALVAGGERSVRVPPNMMGQSRRAQRQPGKSDEIDALAVARAVVSEGPDRFPAAFLDEAAMEIRLLSDHRDDLVAERTRMQNRLRWHLVLLDPELEATLKAGMLSKPRMIERVARKIRALEHSPRARVARSEITHIRDLTRQIDQLLTDIHKLVQAHRPELLKETGCGPLTAAILIGRTAGAQRFRTEACFARHAGVAPIPASSGNRNNRHRLHRGGDRQLNRALHTIAITRARCHPETRAYISWQLQHGKTKREAIRSLKRHLARHIYKLLNTPTNTNHQTIPVTAINANCLT